MKTTFLLPAAVCVVTVRHQCYRGGEGRTICTVENTALLLRFSFALPNRGLTVEPVRLYLYGIAFLCIVVCKATSAVGTELGDTGWTRAWQDGNGWLSMEEAFVLHWTEIR